MTGFIETPRFPDWISFWAEGGRGFQTIVAETYGGNEYRNAQWATARGEWNVSDAFTTANPQNAYAYQQVRNLFNCVMGQLYGFRFKDWKDYQDDGAGVLGTTGLGTGVPTYQMYKNYAISPLSYQQIIQKPTGTINAYRNGVLAGTATTDLTTGIVTFVADASRSISSITVGASTVIHGTGALTGAAIGKYVYVNGVTSTVGALLNGKSWLISNVAGSDVTISAATTGLSGGSGTMYMYPQATEALTWTGEFDVPVRFAEDMPRMQPDQGTGALYDWQSLKVIEIRNF